MFNQFACLAVEDSLHADNLNDSEAASTSLRDVACTDGALEAGANADHRPHVDGNGPPRPVNKPMVWIDLEMTGTLRYYVAIQCAQSRECYAVAHSP
jgi:hypothetical protein